MALAARRRRQPTKRNHTSPFANDPTRLPPLPFSNSLSSPLPNPEHLSTALIDVLLHYSFKFPERGFTMPTDLLVGSSNTMEILKCYRTLTWLVDPPKLETFINFMIFTNVIKFISCWQVGGPQTFKRLLILFKTSIWRLPKIIPSKQF